MKVSIATVYSLLLLQHPCLLTLIGTLGDHTECMAALESFGIRCDIHPLRRVLLSDMYSKQMINWTANTGDSPDSVNALYLKGMIRALLQETGATSTENSSRGDRQHCATPPRATNGRRRCLSSLFCLYRRHRVFANEFAL